jgi:hypothetical protein
VVALDVSLSRRGFLRMSAALLALSRLRAMPAHAQAAVPADGALRVLSPRDARILGAVAERITFSGEPEMPRFGDTAALQTIDTALLQLPPDVPRQLSIALLLFEYGPPLFIGKPASFTGLTPQWQDLYLDGWEQSRFHTRRIGFQAVKNLSMLGYYAQDETWPAIHYSGPWAPKPRRVIPNA